jgi:hypothetical protein
MRSRCQLPEASSTVTAHAWSTFSFLVSENATAYTARTPRIQQQVYIHSVACITSPFSEKSVESLRFVSCRVNCVALRVRWPRKRNQSVRVQLNGGLKVYMVHVVILTLLDAVAGTRGGRPFYHISKDSICQI